MNITPEDLGATPASSTDSADNTDSANNTNEPLVRSKVTFEDLDAQDTTDPHTSDPNAADIAEVEVSAQEAHQLAKGDLNFLAALTQPLVFTFNFPKVFLEIWNWLLHYVNLPRAFPQLALGS